MKKLILCLLFVNVLWAQDSTRTRPNLDLSTPEKTMRLFFQCFKTWDQEGEETLPYLMEIRDPSNMAEIESATFKGQLLKKILDRTERISYDTLPQQNPPKTYTLKKFKKGSITLVEKKDVGYLFSLKTLDHVEDIYAEVATKLPLKGVIESEENLALTIRDWAAQHPSLNKTTLYVKNWQWLLLTPLFFISLIIYGVFALFGQKILRRIFHKDDTEKTNMNLGKPLGIVVSTFSFFNLLEILAIYEDNLFFNIMKVTVQILYSFSLVWFLWQLVNWITLGLERKAAATESKFDDLLVPMMRTGLRIFIVIIGIFIGANIMNYNISHLLAGLGIGSLAFALAAKDTIENLFGSITVIADRPFQIGDWVIIGDSEGSVEKLGFRSTRIRTFYDSQITVPNSKLISAVVDNMGQRTYRRIKTTLGVTYDTPPEKIEAFCEGIRELIRNHPYTRKDYYHVYFNNFGPSSLDILLYCFLKTPDWAVELREKERLFLDIIRLSKDLEINFAFPTQTLWINQDTAHQHKSVDKNFAVQSARQKAAAHSSEETSQGVIY